EASGISKREDIENGLDCGIFNFLVGESIVRAEDTIAFIKKLIHPE
ncbi:MAG: indole-3-glycerol phosphate synthase, partial [Desulfobacterales bacterium]|nr:indole-3-glycerol phosphate synthase [Desulfobacterales bacterium]